MALEARRERESEWPAQGGGGGWVSEVVDRMDGLGGWVNTPRIG